MISIIIPTLNEERDLPTLLESIKTQSFKDYEIIVADANSKDNTKEIAKKYGCIITEGGLPAVGRNKGANIAKGDFLFFFDADVKLPRNFLKKANDEITEKYLDIATCEIKPISKLKIDRLIHKFANIFLKMGQYLDPHAPGFCILVSKRLFKRIKGFDEGLRLGEDHDFVKRASKIEKVRVLESTYIFVSVRRLTKEGRINLIKKYFKVEIHRMFKGEIKDSIVDYEFASYNNQPEEKYIIAFENKINMLEREYKKFQKARKRDINKLNKIYYQDIKNNLINLFRRKK